MTDTTQSSTGRALGEVVRASTSEFVAQCHRLYEAPPLGALVKSEGDTPVYGVVGEVTTQSIDPGRRTMALGEEDASGDAVYDRNPQIARLLTTEFRSIVVGHGDGGHLRRYLAPLPPRIHDFVFPCHEDEVAGFSDSLDFLPLLLAAPVGSPDDVVAAFLRRSSRSHPDSDAFLVQAGKELATVLSGQFQRLNGILKRLAP
jgi:hypothetical protein